MKSQTQVLCARGAGRGIQLRARLGPMVGAYWVSGENIDVRHSADTVVLL